MRIKKSTLWMGALIVLILVGGIFVFSNSSETTVGNVTNNVDAGTSSGEVQKVVIGMKNYNYYPNTIRVKANQPVSISLDKSVFGCYRSFTIPQLGLRKNLATPQDTLNFTPTKKGTYRFACSMGMGTGTLIVE